MAEEDLAHEGGPKSFRNTFLGCMFSENILQDIEYICKEDSSLRNKTSFQVAQKGRIICPLTNAFICGKWDDFSYGLMCTFNDIVKLHYDEEHKPLQSMSTVSRHVFSEDFSDLQFCHLGNSIYKVLTMRNETADSLLGFSIADSINMLHVTKKWVLPRLKEIVPLNQLSCVSDFFYFPNRERIANSIVFNFCEKNHKRQRRNGKFKNPNT